MKARHFTLIVPLSAREHKWVLASIASHPEVGGGALHALLGVYASETQQPLFVTETKHFCL